MPKNTVPLKEYFDALRKDDHIAIELVRAWVAERLESHNGLLKEWRDTTQRDREGFVRKESFDAMQSEFKTYKEQTAKALTLAEGKDAGYSSVRTIVAFVGGCIIALVAVWAATKGLRGS